MAPIHWAASVGDVQSTHTLLKLADELDIRETILRARDNRNATPLIIATQFGHVIILCFSYIIIDEMAYIFTQSDLLISVMSEMP